MREAETSSQDRASCACTSVAYHTTAVWSSTVHAQRLVRSHGLFTKKVLYRSSSLWQFVSNSAKLEEPTQQPQQQLPWTGTERQPPPWTDELAEMSRHIYTRHGASDGLQKVKCRVIGDTVHAVLGLWLDSPTVVNNNKNTGLLNPTEVMCVTFMYLGLSWEVSVGQQSVLHCTKMGETFSMGLPSESWLQGKKNISFYPWVMLSKYFLIDRLQ